MESALRVGLHSCQVRIRAGDCKYFFMLSSYGHSQVLSSHRFTSAFASGWSPHMSWNFWLSFWNYDCLCLLGKEKVISIFNARVPCGREATQPRDRHARSTTSHCSLLLLWRQLTGWLRKRRSSKWGRKIRQAEAFLDSEDSNQKWQN